MRRSASPLLITPETGSNRRHVVSQCALVDVRCPTPDITSLVPLRHNLAYGFCWLGPGARESLAGECRRHRPAARPVEQFDRMDNGDSGGAADLGHAADIAGGDELRGA